MNIKEWVSKRAFNRSGEILTCRKYLEDETLPEDVKALYNRIVQSNENGMIDYAHFLIEYLSMPE